MPIVWNDKARAQLAPRRREDVTPTKPKTAETAWSHVRTRCFPPRGKYDPIDGTFVLGRGKTTPELAELMRKCEPIARSTDAPDLGDVEVASAFVALLAKLHHAQVNELLLALKPVPFAFEARLRSFDFTVFPHWVNWNEPFRLNAAPPDTGALDVAWRALILAQPDDVRSQCKEAAKRVLLRSPNLGQRTMIAHALFDEPLVDPNEVCRAWLAKGLDRIAPLYAIVTDFDVACELLKKKEGSWSYFELINTFGERMLPVLVELAKGPFDRWHAKDVAESLALFDDPLAAQGMLSLLSLASSRPMALSYFGRFPQHAEAALAGLAGMKGRAAKIAREVLAGAQRALASAVPASDEATAEEMPRAIAHPPWLDERKPKRPVTRLDLLRIDVPDRIEWHPGERDRAIATYKVPETPATPETLADYAKMRADDKYVDVVQHRREALPDAVVLEAWNTGQKMYTGGIIQKVQYILAKYGDAALPGLDHLVNLLSTTWGDLSFATRIVSHRMALPFAKRLGDARIGKLVWAWLQKHSELAVLTLVPVAFGEGERADAERALFRLKAIGVDVVWIGARYGAETKAAIENLFSWDPLYDLPKTIPKLGASWHPETVTRPRLLSNNKPLPVSALDTIATMLAFSPLSPPYAGLVQLKEACDPRSLAELSWDTARAWEHSGHKKKEKWMLMSFVHFADDEVVRRMTPGVRPDFAVEVLELISTDAALMEMATIAGRTDSQGGEWTLAGRIEKILERTADARGVTKDELEEDLAPTTMLDEDGSLTLDYGSRQLRVGFDERLEPYVRTESGGRSRAVPPMRKDDDKDKVERAKGLWRDLKEDVTVIAARRIKALERAMTNERTWTVERFRQVWIEHRLMKHLARGVVWTDGQTAFRVSEDGSLSNVDDAPFTLLEGAKIGVAHPLKLAKGDRDKWCRLFEDYELMQAFPQVGREYPVIDETATQMAWPYAQKMGTGDIHRVFGARGYQQGPSNQGRYCQRRVLSNGGVVSVEYKWGRGELTDFSIAFLRNGKPAPAKELPPIELADAIYELQS